MGSLERKRKSIGSPGLLSDQTHTDTTPVIILDVPGPGFKTMDRPDASATGISTGVTDHPTPTDPSVSSVLGTGATGSSAATSFTRHELILSDGEVFP